MIAFLQHNRRLFRRFAFCAAVVAVGALVPAASTGASGGTGLAWPVLLRPAVSSNFCEYREGHLHAGLDIRTFGKRGVPCVAAGDGYVSRMRASARSYGKALYVQLDTGETLVYAHLAEFAPPLERRLAEAQRRSGRYTVDVRPRADAFRVKRGEVIGWSGRTGTSAPHLHFEVRTRGEHPLDPLAHGLAVPDSMRPEYRAVRFLPLAAGARIDGVCFPSRRVARLLGPGRWVLDDTVSIVGPVGVAVDVIDRLNGSSGRLAPRRISLEVGGKRIAEIELDRFSFAHTAQVGFVYDMAAVRSSRRAFYFLLFEHENETLWNRSFRRGGRLDRSDGGAVRRALVQAVDAAGNASTLEFFVRGARDGHRAVARRWPDVPEQDGVYGYGGLLCALTTPGGVDAESWRGIPGVRAGGPDVSVLTAAQIGPAPIGLPFGSGPDAPRLYAVGLKKGQARSIRVAPLETELIVGQRSLYADAVVWVTRRLPEGVARVDAGELVAKGAPIFLGPASLVLRSDIELRFTAGPYDSTHAIYRYGKDGWDFYASIRDHSVISTTCRRPGVYAVFSDPYAPAIRKPFVRRRRPFSGGPAVLELVVPVDDTGSGVDDGRTVIEIAGSRRIARWDFVSRKFFVAVEDANIIGRQSVRVVAFDQAGNRSVLDASVDFSAAH